MLSFTYKVKQGHQIFSFSARLLYEDLTSALPTDVTVTRPGRRDDAALKKRHILVEANGVECVGSHQADHLEPSIQYWKFTSYKEKCVSAGFSLCKC